MRSQTCIYTSQLCLQDPLWQHKQQAALSKGGAVAATAHPCKEKTWTAYLEAKGILFSDVSTGNAMCILFVCVHRDQFPQTQTVQR